MMVMSIGYVKDIMKTIIVDAVRKVLGQIMTFCQEKIINNNLNKLIYFIIIK
jgi:hypothetical protein